MARDVILLGEIAACDARDALRPVASGAALR